ncbi:MAG: hypothetical protein JWM80_2808 [Cyanobacteria bacterium RYN_339]|nr:hypothetical protein [Cyanobacteria bacterium RYN_339]
MRFWILTAFLLAGCGTTPTAAPPDGLTAAVEANARLLFDHHDLDHDGRLSALEAQGVAIAGQTFQALDADGDGGLSWAEFAAPARLAGLARSFREVAAALIKDEDQDGDGRLSREEYRTGMLVPRPGSTVAAPVADPVEQSFAHADEDQDGYLTAREAPELVGFLLGTGYHLQQRPL